MSARRSPPAAMVLPLADPATGELTIARHLADARVPTPFPTGRQPAVLGAEIRTDRCLDGRHLWDAVIVSAPGEPSESEDDPPLPFRLVLTCIRCGLVRELRGRLEGSEDRYDRRLDPVPLEAGCFIAQQIRADSSDGELSTWAVHDRADGPPIGAIGWARGRRGRRYYVGVLEPEHGGTLVETTTPLAALRKLAQLGREAPSAGHRVGSGG